MQLYISIAVLRYFHCSNQHTLSVIFGQDLGGRREIARREEHVISVMGRGACAQAHGANQRHASHEVPAAD
jgi:hypothetical protein